MSDIEKRRTVLELTRAVAGDRRFVTTSRERELIEKAVLNLGLAPFEAQGLIAAGADAHDIALESRVDRALDRLVEAAADKRRRLPKARFGELVRYAKALSNGALERDRAEEKVKRAAERQGITPRVAGLLRSTRWYRRSGERGREKALA